MKFDWKLRGGFRNICWELARKTVVCQGKMLVNDSIGGAWEFQIFIGKFVTDSQSVLVLDKIFVDSFEL